MSLSSACTRFMLSSASASHTLWQSSRCTRHLVQAHAHLFAHTFTFAQLLVHIAHAHACSCTPPPPPLVLCALRGFAVRRTLQGLHTHLLIPMYSCKPRYHQCVQCALRGFAARRTLQGLRRQQAAITIQVCFSCVLLLLLLLSSSSSSSSFMRHCA